MSEELLQVNYLPIGRYRYYKLGASTVRQLKDAGIIRGKIDREVLGKKPDGVIVLGDGTTRAVIEYKPPSKLRTRRQVEIAIEQELPVARALGKLLIVTSGVKSIWINALNGEPVQSENKEKLDFVVDARALARGEGNSGELERLLDAAHASLTEADSKLATPSVQDPSGLANSVWQKIWVQTGKSPEKCLYNVVELFVFKFLSDLGVLKTHNDFWQVENIARQENAADALKHYANSSRKEIQELFPRGNDGTSIINGTIFVNEDGAANVAQAALFAEIIRDLSDFDHNFGSFRYIKREFKTRLYESFLRQSAGIKALGQYFTPRNVVQAMVRMARDLNPGARICDPFCGVGGFLLELLMEKPELGNQFQPRGRKGYPEFTIVGYDKGTDEQEDERTIILAKANMLIYFSDLLAVHHSREDLRTFCDNALNKVFQLIRSNLGTFGMVDDESYDLIVTNPPYVTSGSSSLQAAIAKHPCTAQFYDLGLKGTEGLALNWIMKKLRTGGEALVIVPDSLLRRGRELEQLRRHCVIRGIVSLPSKTFYATPRKTYILALERKYEASEQLDPVFSYVVEAIGETRDSNRLETSENHLSEMVNLFRQFRAAPTIFRSESPRCKVINYNDVKERMDWRVDQWWSRKERVELGLETPRITLAHGEYVTEMERFAQSLQDMIGQCREDITNHKNQKYIETSLGDSKAFEYVTITTGWNKKVLHRLTSTDPGHVPVYTAAASPPAYVGGTYRNIIDASSEAPLVSFGANGDGSAGANFILHESPFYVSGDRTVIRIIDRRLDPHYLLYALRSMKVDYGFDHTHKAVPSNLSEVAVRIPVTVNGEWDIDTQRQIAIRYKRILQLRDALRSGADSIATCDVEIH